MAPYRRPRLRRPSPPPPQTIPKSSPWGGLTDRGTGGMRTATPPYRSPAPPGGRSLAVAAGAPPPGAPGGQGAPDYLAEAQSQVKSQLDPILRGIASRYNAQAVGETAAIGGVTNQYASDLSKAAGQTTAMFNQAKAPISAAAEGINAQLTARGAASAATESTAMASAGQPQGAAGPDVNLAAQGAGAGASAGAIGQAMIDALTSAQNAATQYAGQLPGFAKLQGEYETKKVLVALSVEMADQLAQTTAQAPQLLYSIYNNLLDRAQHDKEFALQIQQYKDDHAQAAADRAYGRQQDAAAAATHNKEWNYGVQQDAIANAQKRAGIVGQNAPTVAGRTAYWQSIADKRTQLDQQEYMGTSSGVRPVDANPRMPGIQPKYTAQYNQYLIQSGQKAATAAAKGRAPSAALSRVFGYVVDANGNPVLRSGKTVPVAKSAAAKSVGAPRPNVQLSRGVGQWVDASGNPIPQLNKPGVPKPPPLVKPPSAAAAQKGTAPRRRGVGRWVTRSGRALSPKQNAIWENMFQNGFTDGTGHLTPGKPASAGGGGASGL